MAQLTNTPRIQYCRTSEGVDLAYFVIGHGPPLLWVSTIFTSHLAVNWSHRQKEFLDVARYCTLSSTTVVAAACPTAKRPTILCPLADWMSRRKAGLGIRKSLANGAGHGCLAAAAYAAEYPDRAERLVLASPYISGDELYEVSKPMKFIASLESVTEEQWEIVSETIAARMLGPNHPRTRGYVEAIRASMEPRALVSFRDANREIDISALLPKIAAPTLGDP